MDIPYLITAEYFAKKQLFVSKLISKELPLKYQDLCYYQKTLNV